MLKEIIQEKEESLLQHKSRSSKKYLESILADDFMEFGSSGRTHSKDDVIEWLVTESPFSYEVSEFETDKLSETVVLATYKIKMKNSLSVRSSLWVLKDDRWQLRFHQGTACP